MAKSWKIARDYGEKQTLGQLSVLENGCPIFDCHTLELPWLNNAFQISCIPERTYTVVKRYSAKFGHHFHITDVEGRTYILVHAGNFKRDTLGCVLVGTGLTDIDGDGLKDVANSRQTLKKLLELMPDSFKLKITKN